MRSSRGKTGFPFQIVPLNANKTAAARRRRRLFLLAHDHLPNRLHIHASEAGHRVLEITLNIK
jgi:hypothetical protein